MSQQLLSRITATSDFFVSTELDAHVYIVELPNNTDSEMNVSCLDRIRRYGSAIPSFLHNRPKLFLSHCMKRLPPSCTPIPQESIVTAADGVYTVTSSDTTNTQYTVRMHSENDSNVPSCECRDWKRHCMPCKHMLAVITTCAPDGWNSLPEHYRSHPLFNLDPEVSAAASMLQSNVAEVSLPPTAQNIIHTPEMVSSEVTVQSSRTSSPLEMTTTEDNTSLATLQSAVRQTLAVMTNCTYSIENTDFLKEKLVLLRTEMSTFQAHTEKSHLQQRFRHSRRLVKSSIAASGLRQRLTAVRAKRRAKKRSWTLHNIGAKYTVSQKSSHL